MGNALGSDDDVTSPFLSGDPRVLETLAKSIGPMPRILLPDTDASQEHPVVKPSSAEMPASSDRTSRIQLLGEIARGGMGAILKGRDPDLGRDLAVKVLLETHRDNPDLIRRFVEEAQIGGQLQHPGIVPVYELGAFGDARPYFTMKLVKGRTLTDLLGSRQDPADQLAKFLGIFEQVAQTVAYAHARGVIHRDLKPSNVMVGSFGEVQVMDWGLAKVLARGGATDDASAGVIENHETVIAISRGGSDSDLSRAGSVMGTPSYMAPEQARGEIQRVDERADVFALGSILCEVLTGQPAFIGRNSGEIQRKAAVGDIADTLARLDACGADPELVTLARDCLAREADDRPGDAGVVDGRVNGYLAGVQDRLRSAERQAAVSEATAVEERKRRKLQAGLAASLVGLMALVGGGYAWNERQKAARGAKIALAVDNALADAARLRGEAQAAPPGETGKWSEATSAIRRAEALLAQGEANPGLKDRVSDRLAQVERERDAALDEAHRRLADRKLLSELESIRSDRAIHDNLFKTSNEYAAAFRKVGLDFEELDPAEAGRRIASRFEPSELAAYLDDWASISRRATRTGLDHWRRLIEVARAADADPWRDALRAALGSKEGGAILNLQQLASDTKALDAQPAASLVLLARELGLVGNSEARERASQVLRRATAHHPGDFWAHFELARGYALKKANPPGIEEAVRHLTAASAIRPGSASARSVLGDALKAQSKADEAIVQFRESLRLKPDSSWVQVALYETLQAQGKLAEEEASCREAVRLKPDDALTHADLAGTLKASGKYDEAIVEFRKAIRLNPDMLLAQVELGGTYYRLNRLAEAATPWREAVRLNPDDAVMHVNLALALAKTGEKVAEIVAEYREAIRLQPDLANYHLFLATFLAQAADLDGAIVEYREAIRIDGDRISDSIWALGDLLLKLDRKNEALAVYRRAREIGRDNPAYLTKADLRIERVEAGDAARLTEIGTKLWEQGDRAEAIVDFRKSIRLRPNSAFTRDWLGYALSMTEKVDEAIVEFREAIRLQPDYLQARNNLGLALHKKGQFDEAIAQWREAVRLVPENSIARTNLLTTLWDRGKRDEAIAIWRARVRFWPDDPYRHDWMIRVWKNHGRMDLAFEALADLRELVRRKPDHAITHWRLAICLRELEQDDEAIAEFRETVRLDGDRIFQAIWDLGELLLNLGRPDEALAVYKRAREIGRDNPDYVAKADQGIAAVERTRALLARIEAVAKGDDKPRDAATFRELQVLMYRQHRHALAARFSAEAFADNPKLIEDKANPRHTAASSALLASDGRDKDDPNPDEAARARLRRQALDWLKSLLAQSDSKIKTGTALDIHNLNAAFNLWKTDLDLECVRAPEALARLPEAEREEWLVFWAEVDASIAKATPTKPGP